MQPEVLLTVQRTHDGMATVGIAGCERSQMFCSEWHGRSEQGLAKNRRRHEMYAYDTRETNMVHLATADLEGLHKRYVGSAWI